MNEIKQILSEKIDPVITDKLIAEYINVKKYHYYNDIEKTILHGARFAECSLAAIKNQLDSSIVNLNELHFEAVFNEITSKPKKNSNDEQLALVIPNVLKTIYSIRNKKRVTHMKDALPDKIDAEYVLSACNWTISQFLIIIKGMDVNLIYRLLESINSKQIPIIEEFEKNEIKVLTSDLSFKDELLVVLYKYSSRISVAQLNLLLKPKNKSYVTTNLSRLNIERLIQLNNDGAIITKLGIDYIESKVLVIK
ncbi:hypothetical protein J4234_02710 [Candidatus Woesearchaeota archaeon]|nr:hypothetical protein [Candidatus Woesearchaeota archaeon]